MAGLGLVYFGGIAVRSPEELLDSALEVISRVFEGLSKHYTTMVPLFSGGYDSLCATYCASQHPQFEGIVYHIDTTIGSKLTRKYVHEVCDEYGWRLRVLKSPHTYERLVSEIGFPGPGAHQWAYNKLKDRCVRKIVSHPGKRRFALITGCRSEESTRRRGHVEPVKVGETSKKTGLVSGTNRIWTACCHDWTKEEQIGFVNAHGFPRNKVKDSVLAMSGECFCGAFARPNEFEMIKEVVPDVAQEILRLTNIVQKCGIRDDLAHQWGYQKGRKPVEVLETGPMCNSCDRKAAAAGIVVVDSPCTIRSK